MSESDRRLAGIEQKLRRGYEHLGELQDLVNAHVDAHPITLVAEPQGKPPTSEYHVKIEDFDPPNYIDLGVRIGEALHLFRSILDNIVWHLSIMGSGQDPPPKPKSVAFPIIELKPDWKSEGLRRLASVESDPTAIIRKGQPFRARHAPNPEPLSLLAALNNKDKHRVIIPMAVMPKSFEQVGKLIVSEDGVEANLVATGSPVEKDATVYIFRFNKPTHVNVEYDGTFAIVLDLAGIKNVSVQTHWPMDKVLTDIANEVRRIAIELKPHV